MKKHRHFIIHKPWGMISQFVNPAKRKKKLLGDLHDFPVGTMAIGRLDVPSEGLLLLTTDGKVSAEIRSHKYEKEYYVQVDGIITQKEIEQLQTGVEIGFNGKKYITKPGKAFIIDDTKFPLRSMKIRDERHGPTSWVSIIITEGKFRQVRKMTAAVGLPTLRLIRVRIGKIELGNLEISEVKEVDNLM
ncbi:pseudouridine synthase [Polaribacter sp. AHE13PA]|uniref:pseudouridine synthase n=1 Tax=Polaribacter sp. AHE13PA TaxID=2745562 RepID=UPI0026760F64|nr:pseudouridine synthase [Polaribacter sp. AHE13PA]